MNGSQDDSGSNFKNLSHNQASNHKDNSDNNSF